MEANAIMQRVYKLSEIWESENYTYPDNRVFSWIASTLVEFKTIRGFSLFQTSLEKTFYDKLIVYEHQFEGNFKHYCFKILKQLTEYIDVWNKTPYLLEQSQGLIRWDFRNKEEEGFELSDFLDALEQLREASNKEQEKLILALYPQHINDFKEFALGISSLLEIGIPESIRFMLYDNYDLEMFKTLEKKHPNTFKYINVDLDMSGAMGSILEDAKAEVSDEKQKDSIAFQQALLNLNEAISIADEPSFLFFSEECFSYTRKYNWYNLEALVYYFQHSFYNSVNQKDKTLTSIDMAIEKADLAFENEIDGARQTQVQYRIAKANYFFFNKKFTEASVEYQTCLDLMQTDDFVFDPLILAGVYQMLGNSLKNTIDKKKAIVVFESGWENLKEYGNDFLKENLMVKFYAKDFLEVLPSENYTKYNEQFLSLWGENWKKDFIREYKNKEIKTL